MQNGSDNSYSEGLEEHNGQSTDADTGVDDESDSELGIMYESVLHRGSFGMVTFAAVALLYH